MTDICLIRPPAVESFRFATTSITLPLGLAYIAAALERDGRSVYVVDAVGEGPEVRTRYCKGHLVGLRFEDVVRRIPDEVGLVGITVVFTHEWPAVVRLVELIKRARPELAIVLGGEHVTSMPEFCLMTSAANYLAIGEGEESIIDLLAALDAGGPLDGVEGIAFRTNGHVIVNKRRGRRVSVDEITPPAWNHFEIENYHRHRFVGGMYSEELTVPILATRGCPYQCTYCSAPNMWLPRWIPRDPKLLVDEIEGYVNTYGARNFPFQDLTAIIQKDWIVTFCREILDRGLEITWQLPTGTRSEAIDAEVAGLLKQAGMTSMAYAPESGSETTRKLIKKKMKTERLFDSVAAAVDADLNVAIFLVIGFPHDLPEHLEENFAFIDRLAEAGVTDLSVGYYMALPGTELFHSLHDSGQITLDRAYFRHILDSLSLMPSQSYCKALSRLDLMRWKPRLLFRFYGAKRRRSGSSGGFLASLRRAASGLIGEAAHQSKLQTANRTGVTSAFETASAIFQPRWISPREEALMFSRWDEIYRLVRREKLALGVAAEAPADTALLHATNAIAAITHDHQSARGLAIPGE